MTTGAGAPSAGDADDGGSAVLREENQLAPPSIERECQRTPSPDGRPANYREDRKNRRSESRRATASSDPRKRRGKTTHSLSRFSEGISYMRRGLPSFATTRKQGERASQPAVSTSGCGLRNQRYRQTMRPLVGS